MRTHALQMECMNASQKIPTPHAKLVAPKPVSESKIASTIKLNIGRDITGRPAWPRPPRTRAKARGAALISKRR